MAASKSPLSSPILDRESPAESESQGCLGALVRLTWMAFGNGVLFILTLKIAHAGRMSALDVLFWAVVVALVVLRHVDITRLRGQTTNGERANLRDWRRYVLCVGGVAALLWALAHTVLEHLI